MNYDLILHSNQTLIENKLINASVYVQDGKIVKIEKGQADSDNTSYQELNDWVLMPGLIDSHVHINEPGRTEWEGFDTATKSAAAGGISTLIDMPLNSSPVTTTPEALIAKLEASKGKLHVNCGFWGGLVPENSNEIQSIIDAGVLGIKAFLTHSGIDEFPNASKQDLETAMPVIAKANIPLLVHCELDEKHKGLDELHQQPKSYWKYLQSRPRAWEDNAIELMIGLCEKFNCKTHIVHLSSSNTLDKISAAKAKNLPLTVETGQHYLYFNAETIPDGQTQFKCAPPIREQKNNALLLNALRNGTIDFVGTDHSPAPPELKKIKTGDYEKAWGGIASIQLALPILWTILFKNGGDIPSINKWMSKNVAKFVGLEDTKGTIAPGFDADFCIWDPNENFYVKAENLLHKHQICPYIGENLYGVVKQTYINGKLVYNCGHFVNLCKGNILLK